MNQSIVKQALGSLMVIGVILCSCTKSPRQDNTYPIKPVPFTSVDLADQFWAPRLKINHEKTIPIAIEQSTITGRIKNFEIAGGLAEGEFCTIFPFDDTDIYKIIEAAGYSLEKNPDPELESKIDSLIYKVGLAQEEDGYLFTVHTIGGDNSHPWVGERWEKVNDLSHELYNLGHMYEAAAAYYRATGKRELLDISIKSADLIFETFGWDKLEDYPGHQEVELGLVKLYNVTGDNRYLDLARFFLDVRGPDGQEYNQAHKKVVDQTQGVGHSVRATYMYAAMADIAALYQDESYIKAIRAIWEDIVHRKMYVTGGIGASGGNEGFGEPYHLPNMTAYCETCASVGNLLWNYRMFLYDGNAKYMDVFERTLYNAFLSGVSLTGDRFFYPNALESYGQHERSAWFGCACCPPNVARTLPSLPGYIYASTEDDIFVNLFMANTAIIEMNGNDVQISQSTDYPWEGRIEIAVNPEKEMKFALHVRIPGWAANEAIPGNLYTFASPLRDPVTLTVNGEDLVPIKENGYATIKRKWKSGDKVIIELPMEIRQVVADERVKADIERISIQRGPLMYCAEWPDAEGGHVLNMVFDPDGEFTSEYIPELLNGVQVIKTTAAQTNRADNGEIEIPPSGKIMLIPYFSWNNRGAGEMTVWLPTTVNSTRPIPEPTVASTFIFKVIQHETYF